jgi:hypothetical protein
LEVFWNGFTTPDEHHATTHAGPRRPSKRNCSSIAMVRIGVEKSVVAGVEKPDACVGICSPTVRYQPTAPES